MLWGRGLWSPRRLPLPGPYQGTLKARGVLRCGVSEGIPGFSQRDASGRWTGLDADFCRAVAAAVLGDADKVEFVPLKASLRFQALEARRVDLLARNTTWTLTREAVLGVQFPAVLFYDGQGFMVPAASKVSTAKELDGATVCVEKGTTHERNLARYAGRNGLILTPLAIDSAGEVAFAFFAGRCAAYSSDSAQLVAARLKAPAGPEGYRILPERISKEPLAPAVWGGDPRWASVVRWVLFALILAEEECHPGQREGQGGGRGRARRLDLDGCIQARVPANGPDTRLGCAGDRGRGQLWRDLRAQPRNRESLAH